MTSMMRAFILVLVGTLSTACAENPVGRLCSLGVETEGEQAVVASPSLDCVSRTCLKVPLESPALPEGSRYPEGGLGLCTAECESDDDCDRVPESPCQTGFTCAIPVTVGTFACQRFCVCKDYLDIPEDGEVPTPAACQ